MLASSTELRILKLSNNSLGAAGGLAIIKALAPCRALECLHLRHCGLDSECVTTLTAALPGWRFIREVDIGLNQEVSREVKAKFETALGKCVKKLDASGTSTEKCCCAMQ